MQQKRIHQAVILAVLSMPALNLQAQDYAGGSIAVTESNSINESSTYDGVSVNISGNGKITTGTQYFSNNSMIDVGSSAQNAFGDVTATITSGSRMTVRAQNAITEGTFTYRDDGQAILMAENSIAGGTHNLQFSNGAIHARVTNAISGGIFNIGSTGSLYTYAENVISNATINLTGGTLQVSSNALGDNVTLNAGSGSVVLSGTGGDTHGIGAGNFLFSGTSSLQSSMIDGVYGGNYRFENSARLQAYGNVGAVSGGTQTFSDNSVMEVRSHARAVTGGVQVFNGNSRLDVMAGGGIDGGTQTFNGYSILRVIDNLGVVNLHGAIDLASATSEFFLGRNNQVIVSNITGQGNIVTNGAAGTTSSIQIDNAYNLAYAGDFRSLSGGNMDVIKEGQGAFNFTGNMDSLVSLTVNSGTFYNNGVAHNALVTDGGTIAGNGSFNNLTLDSGAFLAPGNSIGSMLVNGDFTLMAGATYLVEVDPAGHADFVKVIGNAIIDGNLFVDGSAGTYVEGTQYNILDVDGTITGNFASVGSNLAFMNPDVQYGTNGIIFSLVSNGLTPGQVGSNNGGNANQNQAAEGLAGVTSPTLNTAVQGLTVAGALDAFSKLGGEIHASTQAGLIEETDVWRNAVQNRLARPDGKNTWLKVSNSNAYTGETSLNDNVIRRSNSVMFGADRTVGQNDDWTVGVVAGYGNISSSTRQSIGRIDSAHLGAYAGTSFDNLQVKLGTTAAYYDMDTSRDVKFGTYASKEKADYSAFGLQAFADVGYAISTGAGLVEPFINVAGVQIHRNSFREHGGDTALSVKSDNSFTTFATLGARINQPLMTYKGSEVRLVGSVGYRNASGDVRPESMQNLVGGNLFSTAGNALARNALVFDLGFEANIGQDLQAGIGYRGMNGDNVRSHTTQAFLSWVF